MKTYLKYTLILVLMLVFINMEAQTLEDAIGFEETVNDATAAPIHFLISLAMAIGAALGIKKLR